MFLLTAQGWVTCTKTQLREVVLLVLLNLSVAFDTVDHGCLMSILRDGFSVGSSMVSRVDLLLVVALIR